MDKNHPGQNLPDKKPSDKTPANNWDRICTRGLLSGFFVLGLKFKVMFNLREWTKTTLDKTCQTKNPLTKPPRTIGTEFVQGGFCPGFFVLGLLKIVGGPRCVTYFRGGVPGCVTKCDRGRVVKICQK